MLLLRCLIHDFNLYCCAIIFQLSRFRAYINSLPYRLLFWSAMLSQAPECLGTQSARSLAVIILEIFPETQEMWGACRDVNWWCRRSEFIDFLLVWDTFANSSKERGAWCARRMIGRTYILSLITIPKVLALLQSNFLKCFLFCREEIEKSASSHRIPSNV